MSRDISTSSIDSAVSALERAANVIDNTSGHYRYAREYRLIARDAAKELSALNGELPRLIEAKRNADRAYDAHVSSVSECCSCHINPPCSYCTSHCAECEQHVDDCECEA